MSEIKLYFVRTASSASDAFYFIGVKVAVKAFDIPVPRASSSHHWFHWTAFT